MPRLRLRMTVELGLRGPKFYRWLPIGADNGIRLCRDSLELLLWFDAKSAQWASEVTEETIPRHVNLTAHRIYADITATMGDIELLSYMSSRDFSRVPNEEEERLEERYEAHGREVFSLLRDGVSRLLTFIRVEKGQFWLDPLDIDLDRMASHSAEFEARAQVDNGPWFRWQPTQSIVLRVEAPIYPNAPPRFLTATDWPKAQAFVSAGRQPDLTCQLLVAAERFADAGSERVALTEAVTALEIAVSRFMDSPKADYVLSEPIRSRLGFETLGNLHRRRGLTASVAFLLPILFDQSTLPNEVLANCRQAIVERQNVIHGGQRRVDPDKLRNFLGGIRYLCEVLQEATAT
jgi:hypothetical protein